MKQDAPGGDLVVLQPRPDSPSAWQAEVNADIAAKCRELAERAERGELAGLVFAFATTEQAFGYTWSKTSNAPVLLGAAHLATAAYELHLVENAE